MAKSKRRVEFGFGRTKCDCAVCVDNCKDIPGCLSPSDLGRLIPSGVDPEAWARRHLLASPGTKILRVHADGSLEVIRIGTLVPATRPGSRACHWLKDGRCQVHANAPFGCAFFDCSQTREQGEDRLAKLNDAIRQDNAENGLYSRLWIMLWTDGLRSLSPEVKRAARDIRALRQHRSQ